MTKEEYIAKQASVLWRIPSRLVAHVFDLAFMSSKKLNRRQAEELKKLIDEYKEDEI